MRSAVVLSCNNDIQMCVLYFVVLYFRNPICIRHYLFPRHGSCRPAASSDNHRWWICSVTVVVDSILYSLLRPRTQTTSTTSREVQVVLSRSLYRLPAGMSCHLIGETGLIPLSNIPKPTPRTSVKTKTLLVFDKCLSFSSHYFNLLWSQTPAKIACSKHEQESRFSRKKITVFWLLRQWVIVGGRGRDARSPSFSTPSPLLAALLFREVRSVAATFEVRVQQATAFVISCAVVYICVYIPVLS